MIRLASLAGFAAITLALPSTAFAASNEAQAATCVSTDLPTRGERVALIIANSAYRGSWSVLNSPAADQAVVANALGQAGFTVGVLCDADHAAMKRALDRLAAASKGADAALVYFAGHGFEWRGHNYLAPVDAGESITTGDGAPTHDFVSVDALFDAVGGANAGLVLFDACRSEIAPTAGNGDAAMLGGANSIAGNGMAIGFSTAQGRPALDAAPPTYLLSPFAESLGEHILIPGLELGDMYRAIHRDVRRRTSKIADHPQEPWLIDNLAQDFYFRAPLSRLDPTIEVGEPLEVDIQQLENGDEFAVVSRLLKERSADGIGAWARAGDPMAQYLLSYMLEFGVGVARDREQAASWLAKSAQGGNPAALTALGFRTSFTSGTAEEDAAGIAMLERAAGQGFARAAYFLEDYEQAALDGDPYSAYLLADRGDPGRAFELLAGMHLAGDDMAAVWFCELAVAQQAQDEALDACGIAARAGFPSAQAQFATLISQMPQEDGGLGKAAHWGTLGRPTVFFELDRAEPRGLNQQEVIAALIEQLGARRYSKITLKGHTDQLFSASYSEGLGHRLTSSIQQQLVAAGVPAGRIETVSFGSSDPITKGFGIQPLNRRVEIEVDWDDQDKGGV